MPSSGVASIAGVLTRADLEKRFPAPFMLGEQDASIPVWRTQGSSTVAMS